MIFLSRFFIIIRIKEESRDKNINVKRYLDEEG